MRILIVLTYYRPHTSGLTIYVQRLAKQLVHLGHKVTILTSQYEKSLPRKEISDGISIVRCPVLFRVSKGVIMPTFGFQATRLVLKNDLVHLHLPQFDAAGVALRAKLFGKPTVITYHCDLQLPPGLFNPLVNRVVQVMNNLAAIFADRIVAYTDDFASHSTYLSRFRRKLTVIPPPVELPPTPAENPFRTDRRPVIGMATRFAAEKGVEVLLDALPKIIEKFPNAIVLFAGQYENVLGEKLYAQRLLPRIQKFEQSGHWKFLGVLDQFQMAAFYPNLDVLLVPSLNSTESFGLVQIEAMISGVPAVASDLPGVRQPVQTTGMGKIFPTGNADALADAVLEILENPDRYKTPSDQIKQTYAPAATAKNYEALFKILLRGMHR